MQATLGESALVHIAKGLAVGEARGQRRPRENAELRVSELVRDVAGSLCDPAFKRGFADNISFIEELRQGRRERAAAYWLHVPWVCAYQTMRGGLSPADLQVATCGICTVRFMVAMRHANSSLPSSKLELSTPATKEPR
jgi:hypothetical protein